MNIIFAAGLAEVLPFALLIAVSPIPLVATLLTLFSAKAQRNGPAFLLGWMLGLSVICSAAVLLIEVGEEAAGVSPSLAASAGRVALGLLLFVAGLNKWQKRRQRRLRNETPQAPAWMAAIDKFAPWQAAISGFLLAGAMNPKNTVLIIAAAMSIVHAGLAVAGTIVLVALFVCVGSLGVLLPLLYLLKGGESAKTVLKTWQARLLKHNDLVVALTMWVFGAWLISRGIGELLA